MKNDSRQTMTLIGVALLVIAGIMLFISLKQPAVYEEPAAQTQYAAEEKAGEAEPDAAEEEEETEAKTDYASETKVNTVPESQTSSDIKYPINLNTATLEELMSIKDIGEYRASAILEYRDVIGKYKSVEQIKEIKGFDDTLYNSIAGYLCV